MASIMDNDLQYLVHFFTDKKHLFKTITMANPRLLDEISDNIASQKGWYWFRYRQGDREDYLKRRLFVEREMYEGYTREFGQLKEKVPVYFYIYPNATKQWMLERGQQRKKLGEITPQILLVEIQDIDDTTNLTFTVNDSFAAYWKKAVESGIKCRTEEAGRVVLPDHNRIFPFSMIDQIHQKYKGQEISYEVQVWDYDLLSRLSFVILEQE
jgi:hypothetical protein